MTDDSGGVYILGDTFLRNFVTTFDFEAGEIRLTINKYASEGVKVEYKMSGVKIFAIVVGCLLALVCFVACIYYCLRGRKKRAQA
mmetsp:Transcript_27153/g.33760  ORF Transcript_27153/g.33760 Transcript_27153/m.33760 type:complete len:85 (+) Transcript_27153:1156-1410(+)